MFSSACSPHQVGETCKGPGDCAPELACYTGRCAAQVAVKGGRTYVGELANGVPHGRGKYDSDFGLKYEGDWQFGLREGKGTEIRPDGTRFTGQWNRDEPVVDWKPVLDAIRAD